MSRPIATLLFCSLLTLGAAGCGGNSAQTVDPASLPPAPAIEPNSVSSGMAPALPVTKDPGP